MTRKVSERRYKSEISFRREVQRRLGIPVPDDMWDETGAYVWRDADLERGYAHESELNFVLMQLRHRRARGELPAATTVTKEPHDPRMWRLRSLFLAWQADAGARQWRQRSLASPPHDKFTDEAKGGVIRSLEFQAWLASLVRTEGNFFLAKPLARQGPHPRIPLDSRLLLSFPSGTAPRFVGQDALPEEWWSGSDIQRSELIEVDAVPATGGSLALELNAVGSTLLHRLPRDARWIAAGWDLAQTTGFLIFGAAPLLAPLTARFERRFDNVGFSANVALSIDARISATEVASFYRDIIRRKSFRMRSPTKLKGFSERVVTLLDFVFSRRAQGEQSDWNQLWREWQAEYGHSKGWNYSSPHDLARVTNRAIRQLEKELSLPAR